MKNLKPYFNWHYIVLIVVVLLIVQAVASGEWRFLYFLLPLMVVVGIVQLITGIAFTCQDLPIQFKHDWRTYWFSSVMYFVILYGLYPRGERGEEDPLFNFWLIAVPWFIVMYQFQLVNRINKWRNSGENAHKNHKP